MRLTAPDLLELGLIDGIIPEPPGGAHNDYDLTSLYLRDAIKRSLAELNAMTPTQLIDQRYERFRKMGNFFEEVG